MNPLRSRISFRSSTTPTSRAHLSPLARTPSFANLSSRGTTLAPAPRSWPAARALELAEANHATRWWDPQLLDRLEAPLTRFHD
jgi:hypothetical protein